MPLSGLPFPILVVCALGTWALATRHVVAAAQGPQWVSWFATVAGPVVAVILGLVVPVSLLPVRDVLAGWVCAWVLMWSVTGGKPSLLLPPGPSPNDRSRAQRAALLFVGISLVLVVASSTWPSAFLVHTST